MEILSRAIPAATSIEEHPSFHGTISMKKAKSKLKKEGKNCHLTWYNEKGKMYILSVCWNGSVKHYELVVNCQEKKYEIKGTKRSYKDFYQLLNFYRNFPLNSKIKGIGYFLEAESDTSTISSLTSGDDEEESKQRSFSDSYVTLPDERYQDLQPFSSQQGLQPACSQPEHQSCNLVYDTLNRSPQDAGPQSAHLQEHIQQYSSLQQLDSVPITDP
jgi:hypothetical protein